MSDLTSNRIVDDLRSPHYSDESDGHVRFRAADELDRLTAEVLEQCRLNGLGSEREAALMGKVERLTARVAELEGALKNERSTRRWNMEITATGFRVCKGEHEKSEECDFVDYVPATLLERPQEASECPRKGDHMTVFHRDACPHCNPTKSSAPVEPPQPVAVDFGPIFGDTLSRPHEPPQRELSPDAKRVLYGNMRELIRRDGAPVEPQGFYVEEMEHGRWQRSALGHMWALESDARGQLEDLRRRYPDRLYRLHGDGGAPVTKQEPSEPRETRINVWLVERSSPDGARWATANYQWTQDVNEAAWFVREIDACLTVWNIGPEPPAYASQHSVVFDPAHDSNQVRGPSTKDEPR